MINKKVVVTLADSNYYDMLLELITSIRSFPQSTDVDICILDAGLSKDQVNLL